MSIREIIERERRGILKPYRFSYKMTRFKLSDILIIEEGAPKLPIDGEYRAGMLETDWRLQGSK